METASGLLTRGPFLTTEEGRLLLMMAGRVQRLLGRAPWIGVLSLGISGCGVAGCSPAPSQTILGSYFPSWMICALAGLAAAIVIRQVLVGVGIDKALPVPLVVYLAFAIAFAFATWLLWLG